VTREIVIGEGRTLQPVTGRELGPERIVAYIETHPSTRTGEPCSGSVPVDPTYPGFGPRPMWTVVSEDPLTLTPSLQCRACGDHGFVTNGKWVPA
jgi:hypothetical protein